MSSAETCLPLLPFTRESATLKVRRAETAVIQKIGLGLYPGHEMAQRPEFITSHAEAQAFLLNGAQGVALNTGVADVGKYLLAMVHARIGL